MKPRLVSVVNQLVPYHDARFNAASEIIDLSVIEVFGQAKGSEWSKTVDRRFESACLECEESGSGQRVIESLHNELDDRRPSLITIQGWSSTVALAAMWWAIDNKASIIVFSESNQYDHARRFVAEQFKRVVLSCCDSALVGAADHAEYLCRLGFNQDRIAFGYNVVDNAHFERQSQATAKPDRSFLVVSRLIDLKNVDTLIRAFAKYTSKTQDPWKLKIAGKGPLKERLQELALQLSVEHTIEFLGFQSYEQLPDLYHQSGVFVLPSKIEPWGLVVNEAMAAGLPILVSNRVGSAKRLLKEGQNGYSFDPDDEDELSNKMSMMSSCDDELALMGQRSRQIIDGYGPRQFASGLANAIEYASESSKQRSFVAKKIIRMLAQRPSAMTRRG